jgi:hypothetical protein
MEESGQVGVKLPPSLQLWRTSARAIIPFGRWRDVESASDCGHGCDEAASRCCRSLALDLTCVSECDMVWRDDSSSLKLGNYGKRSARPTSGLIDSARAALRVPKRYGLFATKAQRGRVSPSVRLRGYPHRSALKWGSGFTVQGGAVAQGKGGGHKK